MEPGVPCRRSHAYKSGHYNRDPDIKFAATPPIDGTLCKYYILPEDFCVKLPDHVSLDEGALVEPTAVAVHAVKNSNIKPGSKVVVFGAGPIGLLLSSVAKAWGASTIVTVDLVESRLELSKKMGATHTFVPVKGDSIPETAAKIRALIGATPDVVLEASGAAVPANTGVEVLGFGGTYMQVGMASGAVSIPAPALVFKELKMTGSFRYDYGDYDLAVEFISTGKVNVKPIITHNVNFEDAEEAYKLVRDGKAVKCVINGPE
jgi:2-desacetyl-2-hydroxyethyl bacteriochlorophyllide A dehydrogenase